MAEVGQEVASLALHIQQHVGQRIRGLRLIGPVQSRFECERLIATVVRQRILGETAFESLSLPFVSGEGQQVC